jgi:hypothetical protein
VSEQLRTALSQELQRLQTDILYTEKSHFAAAEARRWTQLGLGICSTIGSTLAAATIIAAQVPVVGGIGAVSAAICSGLLLFTKPEEIARQHYVAATGLGALRVQVRQAAELDVKKLPASRMPELRDRITEFARTKAELDERAPGISALAFMRASRKIKRGDFSYS